jgi:hypothetical protein
MYAAAQQMLLMLLKFTSEFQIHKYHRNYRTKRISHNNIIQCIILSVSLSFSIVSCNQYQDIREGIKSRMKILRLNGGSEEVQARRLRVQHERAAERRIVIERLKAEIETTENQRVYGSDQPFATEDPTNLTSMDFFTYDDEVEKEPATIDDPHKGWNPALLDLEDRGSSFDAEQDLYVQTATEISPLYDGEYEQVQRAAAEQGLDPLPDRSPRIALYDHRQHTTDARGQALRCCLVRSRRAACRRPRARPHRICRGAQAAAQGMGARGPRRPLAAMGSHRRRHDPRRPPALREGGAGPRRPARARDTRTYQRGGDKRSQTRARTRTRISTDSR